MRRAWAAAEPSSSSPQPGRTWRGGVPGDGEESLGMERRSAWAPALVWMEVELWRLEVWGGAPARELLIAAGKGDQRGDLALDWSGAGSRRGRTPEMRTTEEPGEGGGGTESSSAWRRGGATESWRREGAMEKDDDLSAISIRGQFCNFTTFHLVGKDPPATIISERRE
uniref:Uncharacterized protein n=4 Tax=Aegilops tauschii subsp. strangulata TaxID=200361 RepID=A0A453R538_AEGTS